MRELEISRETLLRDLAAIESKRDAARSQWEDSDARIRESTAEMDQLQKRLMAVQNELKDAEIVRQDVQKLRIEKVEIERDASALRYKIEEANSIYERLTKEVDEESSKLRAITADAKTVANQLAGDEQVVRELESRKLLLEDHCRTLEENLSDQEHRYERAKGALEETEAELKHTEKQVAALRSQLAALEQARFAGESQDEELADSLRSANAKLADVMKRLGDGETRMSELGEASEAQARELEERRSQLAGIQTTIAAVEAQKASVQTELVEYDRLRLLAIDNLKQLQNQLHLGVEHERQLQRQFEAIAAQHEALHAQLRQGQEAKDNLMRELEAESRVLAKLRAEQAETLDRIARTGAVASPNPSEFPIAPEPLRDTSPVAAVSSSSEKPVAEAAVSAKNRTRDVEVSEEDAWGKMLDELSATTAAAKRAVRADSPSDERKNVA
jgi:chromosome segregation ATPase